MGGSRESSQRQGKGGFKNQEKLSRLGTAPKPETCMTCRGFERLPQKALHLFLHPFLPLPTHAFFCPPIFPSLH